MHRIVNNISTLSIGKRFVLLIIFFMSLPFVGKSQEDTLTPQSLRQEVWPELNLYYRFNEKFRLFAYLSGTQLKSSSYTDGALSVNLEYFAMPIWRHIKTKSDSSRGNFLWLRAGFLYSRSPPDDENVVKEYTIMTEANARIYLPFKFLLIPKNRLDWRFVNGDFTPRYRAKLQLERDISTGYLSFNVYGYAEYFVNINSDAHNRTRFALGSELKVSKHANFEVYFVHQFDNGLGVPTVDAIGLALKLFFHKGDKLFGKRES
ncbi:MAG: DUF2490 domain-containing protein [Flavisolibacter sp.]